LLENKYFLISFFLFFAIIPLVGWGEIYAMGIDPQSNHRLFYVDSLHDQVYYPAASTLSDQPLTSPGISLKGARRESFAAPLPEKGLCRHGAAIHAVKENKNLCFRSRRPTPYQGFFQILQIIFSPTKG